MQTFTRSTASATSTSSKRCVQANVAARPRRAASEAPAFPIADVQAWISSWRAQKVELEKKDTPTAAFKAMRAERAQAAKSATKSFAAQAKLARKAAAPPPASTDAPASTLATATEATPLPATPATASPVATPMAPVAAPMAVDTTPELVAAASAPVAAAPVAAAAAAAAPSPMAPAATAVFAAAAAAFAAATVESATAAAPTPTLTATTATAPAKAAVPAGMCSCGAALPCGCASSLKKTVSHTVHTAPQLSMAVAPSTTEPAAHQVSAAVVPQEKSVEAVSSWGQTMKDGSIVFSSEQLRDAQKAKVAMARVSTQTPSM